MTVTEASGWTRQPKIYALGSSGLGAFHYTSETIVEEKVDGSQLSFGLFDGKLLMKSKSVEYGDVTGPPEPGSMFAKAWESVESLREVLSREDLGLVNVCFRAEYLSKPKHNAICYERVPEKNIILFGASFADEQGGDYYVRREALEMLGGVLGLEVTPVLHRGAYDTDKLDELLKGQSVLGGMIEGVVIKTPGVYNRAGEVRYGKYVSSRFKEIHKASWAENKPSRPDILAAIAESVCPPARLDKAIMRIRERGELKQDPSDIGPLIKEVLKDVREECVDDIKEKLYNAFHKEILRRCTRPIPETYKQMLTRDFGDELAAEPDTQP